MRLIRIPADLDRPDKFVLGLTLRQLLVLSPFATVTATVTWGAYLLAGFKVALFAAVLPGGLGIGAILIRLDGLSIESAALAVARFGTRPKHLVDAPDGLEKLPRLQRIRSHVPRIGILRRLWAEAQNGDVRVGTELVRMFATTSLDFALRSDEEQQASVDGFAALLNALDSQVHVLVRGELVDVEHLANKAGSAMQPRLWDAATDHEAFLRQMEGGYRRQVYWILRARNLTDLDIRTDGFLQLLQPIGIGARQLSTVEAEGLLARSSGSVEVE